MLHGLHSRYNRKVVEQAAIAGVLNADIFGDPAKATAAAHYIARRLDALADETERGWQGEFDEGEGFRFERTVRGVKEVAVIDQALLGSADARKLDEHAASLQAGLCQGPARCAARTRRSPIHGPVGLFEAVTAAGRKGLTLQRYKGLGEMNPEQLWETTLDPNARSLLQVKVKEIDEADDIFTKLMGDDGRAAPRLHPGERAHRQRRRVGRMQFGYAIAYVPDVEATIAFWERAFSLKRRMVVEGGDYGELETGATRLAFAAELMASATTALRSG